MNWLVRLDNWFRIPNIIMSTPRKPECVGKNQACITASISFRSTSLSRDEEAPVSSAALQTFKYSEDNLQHILNTVLEA